MLEIKIDISPEIFEKCTQFAINSSSSSFDKYAKRNQYNKEKIIQDIRNGKLGEEIIYQSLLNKFPTLSSPDYQIYDKKQKNWSSDLLDENGIKVACKSQESKSELLYDRSWVFQYNSGKSFDCDTGIFGKIDESHYVALCSLNVPKKYGIVRAFVKVSWLHKQDLFKPMKLQKFANNKLAVYWDDLFKYKNELWQ